MNDYEQTATDIFDSYKATIHQSICGGAAGLGAVVFGYPFDVVKTRM